MEIFRSIQAIQRAGTAVLLVEQEHGRFVREGPAGTLAGDGDIRRVYLGV